MMAGGEDMENLSAELDEFERTDREEAARSEDPRPAEAFHEESDAINEEEDRGRENN